MRSFFKHTRTPVGTLKLIADADALQAILWENDDPKRVRCDALLEETEHGILLETEQQLAEYFRGERTTFSIPLAARGTPFQQSVWAALLEIPFGETRSYGEIARRIGSPDASRAVGAANGKNPISIIVPCHRVIGSSGKLTGFAGGLTVKQRLLALEDVQLSAFEVA
jgi:methylated-DNA-[protein]-cysteine S-methyltransferase